MVPTDLSHSSVLHMHTYTRVYCVQCVTTHNFPHHYYFQLLTCYGNCQRAVAVEGG